MKERPILFSAPMVRAILAGRKTQTRRLVGLHELKRSTTPGYDWTWRGQAPVRSIAQQRRYPGGCWQDVEHADLLSLCPYGVVGDRLWVRETWRTDSDYDRRKPSRLPKHAPLWYEADNVAPMRPIANGYMGWGRGRPSIFMRRWMSRITLELTAVRVEPLRDISESDAGAEGVCGFSGGCCERCNGNGRNHTHPSGCPECGGTRHAHRALFERLWDSINRERAAWSMNPWVWVLDFKTVEAV